MAVYTPYYEQESLARPQGTGAALQRPVSMPVNAENRANSQLVGAAVNAGLSINNTLIGVYRERLATKVTEANLRYNKILQDEKVRYMQENQGENALDAGGYFENFARQKAEEMAGEFEGINLAQSEFMRMSVGTALRYKEIGDGYAAQQKDAWQKSVLDSAFAQFDQDVAENYTDPAYIEHKKGLLKEQVQAMRPGLDNSGVFAEIDKKDVSLRIHGYLAERNVGAARGLYENQLALLGDNAPRVKMQIDSMAKSLEAEAKARAAEAKAKQREELQLLTGKAREAEELAKLTGNTQPMLDLAVAFENLGSAEGANVLRQGAERFEANKEAILLAPGMTLGDMQTRVAAIDVQLAGFGNTDDLANARILADERDILVSAYKNKVNNLEKDPALAVDGQAVGENIADRMLSRMALQEANGVPLSKRKPATQAEVAQYREMWETADVAGKISMVQELESAGKFAPLLFAQMGIDAAQADIAQSVKQNAGNADSAKKVFTALSLPEESLPKRTVTQELAEFKSGSEAWQVYEAVSLVQPNAMAVLKDYEKAGERLLKVNGGDINATIISLDAGRQTLLEDNKALFVPAGVKPSELNSKLDRYFEKNLSPFLETRQHGNGETWNKQDVSLELRRLSNTAVWINSPDGNGYILIDGASQTPVRNSQGEVFRVTDWTLEEAFPPIEKEELLQKGLGFYGVF